jgi:isopentenyldiphosphate isomerase
LDLVDENDQVIGTIHRGDTVDSKHKGYLRASELLIINDNGQLWIPRRQMHKRLAPGGLDYSAAGHVASGDDYAETLKREVEEELNLKLDKSKLEFLHKFKPRPDLPPYFRAVYLYRSNEIPKYNSDDFSEYYWMEPKELLDKLDAGEPAKQSLKETIEYLIENSK